MCSHYRPPSSERLKNMPGMEGLTRPEGVSDELWPGYVGVFIRRPSATTSGDETGSPHEILAGVFGLLPSWSKDDKLARQTYNARSETAKIKPSFRDAWRWARHCIVPVDCFYEPDWRSGKSIPTRIALANGEPMGIAGLWEYKKDSAGKTTHSYAMLTVNADDNELMRNFHRPGTEKRMPVILPASQFENWLDAPADRSMELLLQFPAEQLVATPATK